VKEARERRVGLVLLAKGKRCARRVGISIGSANFRLRELFIVCLSPDCIIIYCYVKNTWIFLFLAL